MLSKQILVISGNQIVFQSVKKFMQNDSTDVIYAMSVMKALNYLSSNEYCLVIMPISLPINSDVTFLRIVRETHPMPIIVLTPKLGTEEKVILFHAGANACLEQPMDTLLCIAQAHSLIQLYLDAKTIDKKEHPLVYDRELIINSIYLHVIIDGELLELTRTEFDLLYYTAKQPNQIFTRQQLYRQICGNDLGINGKNTVRSHIGNLYKKLTDVGKTTLKIPEGSAISF